MLQTKPLTLSKHMTDRQQRNTLAQLKTPNMTLNSQTLHSLVLTRLLFAVHTQDVLMIATLTESVWIMVNAIAIPSSVELLVILGQTVRRV